MGKCPVAVGLLLSPTCTIPPCPPERVLAFRWSCFSKLTHTHKNTGVVFPTNLAGVNSSAQPWLELVKLDGGLTLCTAPLDGASPKGRQLVSLFRPKHRHRGPSLQIQPSMQSLEGRALPHISYKQVDFPTLSTHSTTSSTTSYNLPNFAKSQPTLCHSQRLFTLLWTPNAPCAALLLSRN